jgi:catechol 2,3-dioxygenase-like lactoylglutathione lyase family enzyme
MIKALSHVTLFVNNQDYVDKLGFKLHTDVVMENGFRWLTVTPPEQPDLEIVLMEPKTGPMFDEESAAALRALMKKGLLGAGALRVDDCRKTYEELKKKGVPFKGEPREQFYGIEAILSDGLGNWFSMTEPK